VPFLGVEAVGPGLLLLVLALLVVLLRWTYGSRPARGTAERRDYGLLQPVARAADEQTARALQDLLAGAGIRSTLAHRPGAVDVLVFGSDAETAHRLVASQGPQNGNR